MIFICVIIYKPKGKTIDENEIRDAWNENPHGAGYIVQSERATFYRKGIMKLKDLLRSIRPYIGEKYALILHFRIVSVGLAIPKQTHPFANAEETPLSGKLTRDGVLYAMNGTIFDITPLKGKNDTETYVIKYLQDVRPSQGLLDLIADHTGALWISATVDGVIYSSNFIEDGGLYYSNLNHRRTTIYTGAPPLKASELVEPRVYKQAPRNIRKRADAFARDLCSNWHCYECAECIQEAQTVAELDNTLSAYGY